MLRASYEDTIIAGNYHNGILTLIIPFGMWGVVAFFWFCAAAFRALVRNLRYGDVRLRTINRFLLATFVTRLVFYLGIYGQFDLDLAAFAALAGLSIAFNGGIRGPQLAPAVEPAKALPATMLTPEPKPA
jgi:hypothetical protein